MDELTTRSDVETKARRNAYLRARYARDPEYRARVARNGRRRYLADTDDIKEQIRWRKIRMHYGLTMDGYHSLFERQGERCACCQRVPAHRLVVDHDHQTGRIRGLLCHQCNKMLGFAKDESDTLRSAAAYIECHAQR